MNGLSTIPRLPLGIIPTPLHAAPRLSEVLGVEVWFKRDDLTGLGLGGNKVRGLEYLLADALASGADCLVTGGGPQSNWAMLAAAAARRCGIDPFLIFYGTRLPPSGNQLLLQRLGADVRFTGVSERTSVDQAISTLVEELRLEGRRAYSLPRGGATPLGSIGYAQASVELTEQLLQVHLAPRAVWLATGSCGTQAGLEVGARWLGLGSIVGVTVSRPAPECRTLIAQLATGCSRLLGLTDSASVPEEAVVLEGYLGPGYGQPSPAGCEAAELVARTEGVFLDPVFAAKAMAALIDRTRSGNLSGPNVFLVTGGAPTLFAGAP